MEKEEPPFLRLVRPQTTPTTSDPPPIESPSVVVDPGQVIRVNARFPDSPETVLFSYLAPHSDVAVHDPGLGDPESKIEREGDLYYYTIDTRGMSGGLGWWYFVSEDPDVKKRRAKVGKFTVRSVPRALLERNAPAATPAALGEDSGLDLLGCDETDEDHSKHVMIGLGVAVGLAFLL
jgi:hypothetical protein